MPQPWPNLLPRLQAPPSLLLLLDFDGTLSELAPRPEDALLRPGNAPLLRALAQLPAIAAAGIISGRALDDVRRRVAIPELCYAGNHGLEITGPEINKPETNGAALCYRHPAAGAAIPIMAEIAARLDASLASIPGIQVENKGITLTLHYRRTPSEHRPLVAQIFHDTVRPAVAAGHCRITAAKSALELRPAVDWHKGRALQLIRARLAPDAYPLYIGDDATDEDAFQAAQTAGGAGVRVAPAGAAPATSAQWQLDSPAAVTAALSDLLTLRRADAAPR